MSCCWFCNACKQTFTGFDGRESEYGCKPVVCYHCGVKWELVHECSADAEIGCQEWLEPWREDD